MNYDSKSTLLKNNLSKFFIPHLPQEISINIQN